MAPSAELVALVDKVPPLDGKNYKPPLLKTRPSDGKFTGPTWEEAVKILDPILKGGANSIVGVIDMLVEVDDGKDYKARYVLHAAATYVCRAGKDKERAAVVKAIASQLGGSRPKATQGFLIRQLQVCGDASVADVLGKHLLDEELSEPAAMSLVAIGDGAAEQLRAALPKAKGKCLLTLVQNLGVVGDAKSLDALRKAAGNQDPKVRLAAVWGLANIGDAGSVDVLIKAADAKDAWERIQAAKACLLLADKLHAAGKETDAAKIYTHLRDTRKDPGESYVSDLAKQALAGPK